MPLWVVLIIFLLFVVSTWCIFYHDRGSESLVRLEDQLKNLNKELEEQLEALQEEKNRLQREKDDLLLILRDLHDEQNGPPLIKYEKEWQATMNRAKKLLRELEKD